MYCKHCGTSITEGAQFCNVCGQPQGGKNRPPEPQPSPAPTVSVTIPTVNLRLDNNLNAAIAIVLSVVSLLTVLMPWLTIRETFITDSFSANLIECISELISTGESLAVYGFIIAFLGVICAILHIFNIYSVVTKPHQKFSHTGAAGLITTIFAVVYFIAVALVRSSLKHELGYAADVIKEMCKVGSGAYICAIISLLQYFIGSKLLNTNSAKSDPRNWVTCPGCNTTYVRYTSATKCPTCHKLPSEAATVTPPPSPTPKKVICPFCKRTYPAGTKFCQFCNAQIG